MSLARQCLEYLWHTNYHELLRFAFISRGVAVSVERYLSRVEVLDTERPGGARRIVDNLGDFIQDSHEIQALLRCLLTASVTVSSVSSLQSIRLPHWPLTPVVASEIIRHFTNLRVLVCGGDIGANDLLSQIPTCSQFHWLDIPSLAWEDLPRFPLLEHLGPEGFRPPKSVKVVDLSLMQHLRVIHQRWESRARDNAIEFRLPDNLESFGGCFRMSAVECVDLRRFTRVRDTTFGCFFACSSLVNVALPISIESLGDYSFSQTSLVTVDLSTLLKLTTLGEWCFFRCSHLTKAHLPPNVEKIGRYCFRLTALLQADYSILRHLKTIGPGCYSECWQLGEVVLPDQVECGDECFPEGVIVRRVPAAQ